MECFAVGQVSKDTGISCGAECAVPEEHYQPWAARLPLDPAPKILYTERFS